MIDGFRRFLFRGNVIDLAVAVVIGAAFGAVVTALVKDLITPLVAAIFGKPDFSALAFTINGSAFLYGDFLNAVIGFVLVAAALYFVVIVPLERITARFAPSTADVPVFKVCPECCSDVPAAARRCKFCTAAIQ
jgi:large conductance mechanosensitive channel